MLTGVICISTLWYFGTSFCQIASQLNELPYLGARVQAVDSRTMANVSESSNDATLSKLWLELWCIE